MPDTVEATIGHRASNVAVGKDIRMSVIGDDVSERDKLDEVYRLVYQVSEKVAVVYTWLVALTIAFAIVGLLLAVKIF